MAIRVHTEIPREKKPNGFIENIGPKLGYKYLGPGTDVRYKQQHGVQPDGTLDREAMKHDIAYADTKDRYNRGEISYDQAMMEIDKADWRLFKGAAGDFYRYKAPNALVGVGKAMGGPLGLALTIGDAIVRKKKAKTVAAGGIKYFAPSTTPLWDGFSKANLAKDAVSAFPTGATSAAMLLKLGLSKIGLSRGAYSGIKKRRTK